MHMHKAPLPLSAAKIFKYFVKFRHVKFIIVLFTKTFSQINKNIIISLKRSLFIIMKIMLLLMMLV